MQGNLTKPLKRELRALNDLAWERELDNSLRKLDESFALWKDGQVTAFDLSDRIHAFHDGENRDLYKFYTYRGGGSLAVSAAIAKGIIDRAEVSSELLQYLDAEIQHVKEFWDEQEGPRA